MTPSLDRRSFAKFLGVLAGTASLPRAAHAAGASKLPAPSAEAAVFPEPQRLPEQPILINSNENPYGPSQAARDAFWRAQDVAGRYPDDVEDRVAQAIAQLHGVGAEQVVLGCGSTEILRLADMAFLAPGKTLVACDPTFEAVLRYARATRAEAVQIPQTPDFRHDLPAMAAACNERTGMVYVCNPNNPNGTIVSRDELAAFVAKIPSTTMVMVDEAYFEFVEDASYGSAQSLMRRHPNVFIVRTFSKIYGMAGLRLGYSISSAAAASAMSAHQFSSNVNAAVGEAALASLADARLVPHARKVNNDLRNWLCAEMEKEGRRCLPSHTNFLMIHVGYDVTPVIEAFARRNIFVGRKFSKMEHWLRVSIGTREEMEAFVAALREIVPAKMARAA